MYVSLEPCAHHGKTPPCANKIVEEGIRKVVIGSIDPFPKVDGKGLDILQKAGIDLMTGVLAEDEAFLNRRFRCFHINQRPYIILRWAESADGYMGKPGEQVWISGKTANMENHRWRAEEDAILVGFRTAMTDDPKLNVRHWDGKDPIRMVFDPKSALNPELQLIQDGIATVVFQQEPTEYSRSSVSAYKIDDDSIDSLIAYCMENNIQSVIVEGGASTIELFRERDLWDEARIFRSLKELGSGIQAPRINASFKKEVELGDDELLIAYHK